MTFLDKSKAPITHVQTPPFLLNCNRTQQRYTNALMLADRFLDEGQPEEQTYFLREGAFRLLSKGRWWRWAAVVTVAGFGSCCFPFVHALTCPSPPPPPSPDAARLLSLYRKTEGNTTYMFEKKLQALKKRLTVDALEHMEKTLPRMRQLRRRQRQAANAAGESRERFLPS